MKLKFMITQNKTPNRLNHSSTSYMKVQSQSFKNLNRQVKSRSTKKLQRNASNSTVNACTGYRKAWSSPKKNTSSATQSLSYHSNMCQKGPRFDRPLNTFAVRFATSDRLKMKRILRDQKQVYRISSLSTKLLGCTTTFLRIHRICWR